VQQSTAFGKLARGDAVRVAIAEENALLFRGDGDGERL
jgi:hypothetical protein